MRLARDLGTVRELLPPEFPDLKDCPWTLHESLTQGLLFLGFEDLPADEMPARNIWLDAKALKEHFAGVRRKREKEMNPDRGASANEDMKQNKATEGLIVGG